MFTLSVLMASSLAAASDDAYRVVGFATYLKCEDAVAIEIARGAKPTSPWLLHNSVHRLFSALTFKFQLNEHDYDVTYLCDMADATGGWVATQLVHGQLGTRVEAEEERDLIQDALTKRFGAPCWQTSGSTNKDENSRDFYRYTYWNTGDGLVTFLNGPFFTVALQVWQLNISTGSPPQVITGNSVSQASWDHSACQKAALEKINGGGSVRAKIIAQPENTSR